MKIEVFVKTRSKENLIEETGGGKFKAKITEVPKQGKANKKLIHLLSEYFKTPPSRIKIIKGEKSQRKMVEIF